MKRSSGRSERREGGKQRRVSSHGRTKEETPPTTNRRWESPPGRHESTNLSAERYQRRSEVSQHAPESGQISEHSHQTKTHVHGGEGGSCAKPSPRPTVIIGKRRGGRVLPCGVIKKPAVGGSSSSKKAASSEYEAEVARIKSTLCTDEASVRPLVK